MSNRRDNEIRELVSVPNKHWSGGVTSPRPKMVPVGLAWLFPRPIMVQSDLFSQTRKYRSYYVYIKHILGNLFGCEMVVMKWCRLDVQKPLLHHSSHLFNIKTCLCRLCTVYLHVAYIIPVSFYACGVYKSQKSLSKLSLIAFGRSPSSGPLSVYQVTYNSVGND